MMAVFFIDICSEIKATMKNKMANLKKPASSKSKQKIYNEEDDSSGSDNNDDLLEDITATITTSSSNNTINSKERTTNVYLTSSATVLAERNSTINVSIADKDTPRNIGSSSEEEVTKKFKK